MINNESTNNIEENSDDESELDEHSGIILQGFLKIHDPETGEIIVQGRA